MPDRDDAEDPVDVLRRWQRSGAVWRVLGRSGTTMTVGLFSCDAGEEMGRFTSSSPELREFVGDRDGSED